MFVYCYLLSQFVQVNLSSCHALRLLNFTCAQKVYMNRRREGESGMESCHPRPFQPWFWYGGTVHPTLMDNLAMDTL